MKSFLNLINSAFLAFFMMLGPSYLQPCLAQDLNAKIPTDPNLHKGALSNGLTYYIHTNRTPEKRVELRLVVKAGSILENDDQQGLAHFMEHMNFRGTKKFPKNELVNYFETIGMKFGADVNANTSYDKTVYELSIPTDRPDNLKKGFDVLEDWAHNALLTDEDIDNERGVVLEESRLHKNAEQRMMGQYYPKLFEGSRYAERMPIGKDSIIANVSHDALRRFYHDWYRPDLMAVIVIGDIDSAEALKMIIDHFSGLINPTPERQHFYAEVPERKKSEAMVLKDKEEIKSAVIISYPYQKTSDESIVNDYRERLKEKFLLQLLRLRLRDLYKSGNQLSNVYFNTIPHGYRSLMISSGFPNMGADINIKAVTYTIKQAATFGFYASEIQLIENSMLSADNKSYNERNKKNSSNYISEYIRNFMDNEQIEGAENEHKLAIALLPTIRNSELMAMLRQWTENENIFTYITAPDNDDVKLPQSNALLDMVVSDLHQQVTVMKEKHIAKNILDEKPEAGKIVQRKEEAALGATTYTLGNGIKVTVKATDFKNDEIKLKGVKKGGKCNYDNDDRINCHFVDALIPLMGYGSFTPNELTKQLSEKNISVTTKIETSTDEVNGSSDLQNIENMLQLVYLKLTAPRKDDDAFTEWKSNYKKHIDNIYANPEIYFADTLTRVRYNDNPLFVGIPDPGDLKELHLKRVIEIYKNEFGCADGYHFFITGNIDTAKLLPLIENYLGSLPVSGNKPVRNDNGLRPISGINRIIVHKSKANKSIILSMYYGDMAYSEEMERNMKAMDDILNIKILQTLRVKMSDIYTGGFSGTISNIPYPHYDITLNLPCGPEHVDELLSAADKEIKAIKENGPTNEDLQKIKAQWHEKNQINLKSNVFWNSEMEKILFSGKSEDNFLNYETFTNNITAEDIRKAANLFFDGKNELTGILMPE